MYSRSRTQIYQLRASTRSTSNLTPADELLKLVAHLQSPKFAPTLPEKIPVPQSLEEKETYRNPFVRFRLNDVLQSSIRFRLPTKYRDLINVKEPTPRGPDFLKTDLVDLFLARTGGKHPTRFRTIHSPEASPAIIFPPDVCRKIQNMSSSYDVDQIIQHLAAELKRYSRFDIVCGLLSLTKVLPQESEQKVVEHSLKTFEIIDQSETTVLLQELMKLENFDYVQQAIDKMNKLDPSRDFPRDATSQLQACLLEFAIKHRKFQFAAQMLTCLLEKRLVPTPDILEKYAKLVKDTAMSVDADISSRRIVFMAYATPLARALQHQTNTISRSLVQNITLWLSIHELFWFLEFLKHTGAVVNGINSAIIEQHGRLAKKSSAIDNALTLTSLIGHLRKHKFEPFDDNCRKLIISQYCKFKSPIAAQWWIDSLREPLSADETSQIIRDIKASPFKVDEKEFPYHGQKHIDAFIENLST
ncbi:hypothetical protein KL949_001418 [Ogataea haglerorum]|nr:hypothetical protein KL913_001808 [Ogataea haglerorum]KAG7721686.1 hypothetical protein KL949_001418 [Ogataea haglerorum]KAG7759523.1 hypothetical protein KL947_001904 [Ogataea haglerorum]KAG7770014.1 hypothetical protein KL931_002533 [Ogataea haglerorum]